MQPKEEYDHLAYGRLMLRCLEAEDNLATAVEEERRWHCAERVAAWLMISTEDAAVFVDYWNKQAMAMFRVGNTIPRNELN